MDRLSTEDELAILLIAQRTDPFAGLETLFVCFCDQSGATQVPALTDQDAERVLDEMHEAGIYTTCPMVEYDPATGWQQFNKLK